MGGYRDAARRWRAGRADRAGFVRGTTMAPWVVTCRRCGGFLADSDTPSAGPRFVAVFPLRATAPDDAWLPGSACRARSSSRTCDVEGVEVHAMWRLLVVG